MPSDKRPPTPDGPMMIAGMVFGLIIGGLVTLFTAPQRGDETRQSITSLTRQAREKIENIAPTDPVEESLAVGKATARRRREELGMDDTG